MTRYVLIPLAMAALAGPAPVGADEPAKPADTDKVIKTDREWQKVLTHDQYMVLRRRATEPPFTGRYATGHHRGIFVCAGCGAELFSSNHKFNSGTGWPSFFRPIRDSALERAWDLDGVEPRVEVSCARCGGHLGHVFADGPPPTGLRYCINSVALKLKPFPSAAKPAAKKAARTRSAEPAQPDVPDAEAAR
jgi:peptide-methionine (R)-S-oxide reductase